MVRFMFALTSVLILAPSASAQEADQLAALFRSLLLPNLPDPLIETKSNWDKQREVVTGFKWVKRPGDRRAHLEPEKKFRNDGKWRKMTVSIRDPANNLKIALRDIVSPAEGIVMFEVWVAFRAELRFDQQIWESGLRLYSGSTRGHCTVVARLGCELSTRFEPSKQLLPDAIIRLRVANATLAYTDFEVDHILGIGGDGAKILGDALHGFIRDVKPNLEAELLAKANAAIVKAGDTKEVRVSLEKLLKGELPKVPLKK